MSLEEETRAANFHNRQISLGYPADTKGDQFQIHPQWLTRGTIIVGKSGTGKSYDIQLVASQAARAGYAVVLLDRIGEHAEYFAGSGYARVLAPGTDLFFHLFSNTEGVDPGEATEDVLDTIVHYFGVSFGERPTPLQQRILRESLLACFSSSLTPSNPLSVREFIALVRKYQQYRRGVKGFAESCEALVSRLYPLTVGRVGAAFDEKKNCFSVGDLFRPGMQIVDLSSLRYEPAKDLVSQMIVKQLYQAARRKGTTGDLRQLVVVDEAHHIAPKDSVCLSFLELIAIENRKFGQGILVATTSPSQLSEALLRNASIRICHLLDDGKDIDLMLRFMVNKLDGDRFIADIRTFQLGEALVQVSSPVIIEPRRVQVLGLE